VVHALGGLAAIQAETGFLGEAELLAERSLAVSRQHGLTEHWANAMAHVVKGKAQLQRGELAPASAAVARGMQLAQRGVARIEAAYGMVTLAQIRLKEGRGAEAQLLLDQARRRVAECPDPGLVEELLARAEAVVTSLPPAGLTEREVAVLRLVAAGLVNADVAERLHLSERTVHAHLRSIYGKLDVHTRAGATRYALDHGIA
jgi:LuxR family maltose regulon positive regulatory protein